MTWQRLLTGVAGVAVVTLAGLHFVSAEARTLLMPFGGFLLGFVVKWPESSK